MSQYEWKSESLPQLKHHSRCKHEILRDYLLQYICVLHTGTLRYGNKKFNLTIVDGCAGGGKFQYGKEVVDGSPFVILNVIQEAKAAIQTKRRQSGHADIDINIDVILVEKDKKTAKFLQEQVRNQDQGFAEEPQIMQGDFNEKLPQIINFIKEKSKGRRGRCLFFLDQYGYSQIELSQVRKILRLLKSEVILTFAVDYLIDYLSKSKVQTLGELGLSPQQIGEMLDLAENTKEHRYAIEHILAQHLKSATGAKFYTPFLFGEMILIGDIGLCIYPLIIEHGTR